MNDLDDNLGQGVLYVSGTRGYSAYEVAVQNGFVGTEQEWLDSLVGSQGEPGTPFDELTEEQKEEIKGDEGKSAYEIAVENGFIGTEQDWVNSFLSPDGYYNKDEIDNKLSNNYYDEVTYTKERHYDTDVYFITIPYKDSNGNVIVPYVDLDNNSTPLEYARKNYTTLTTNAGLTQQATDLSWKQAIVLGKGQILSTYEAEQTPTRSYIGFKADREVVNVVGLGATPESMLEAGITDAFYTFGQDIVNGVANSNYGGGGGENPYLELGVKANKDIIILACDGRTNINKGLTQEQVQELMLNKGAYNSWKLDGGGSTSTSIKGSKLNRNIDDDGTTDRGIHVTFNIKKETVNEELAKAFSKIGEEKQNIIQQIIPNIYDLYGKFNTRFYTGVNLDTAIGENIIGLSNGFTPKPSSDYGGYDNSCYFINIAHPGTNDRNLYNFQLLMRMTEKEIYTRRQVNGVWTEWSAVNAKNITHFAIGGDNTISTTNTYQKVNLIEKKSNNNIIIPKASSYIDDTHFTDFEVVTPFVGYINIRVSGNFVSQTTGRKFVKIRFGSDDSVISKFDCDADKNCCFSLETLERITENSSRNFSVQIYGTADDSITNVRITAELDR